MISYSSPIFTPYAPWFVYRFTNYFALLSIQIFAVFFSKRSCKADFPLSAPLDENSEFARYRRAFHAPSRRLWDHLRDAAPHIRFPQLPPSNHESASLHWPPPQNDWHTEPRSQPQESRPQWASNGAFTRNEPVIGASCSS